MKPFLIKKKDSITDKMVAEVFDKAVAAGAKLENMVDIIQCVPGYGNRPAHWDFFGISRGATGHFYTNFTDCPSEEIITIDKVDEWLQAEDQPTIVEIRVNSKDRERLPEIEPILPSSLLSEHDLYEMLIPGVKKFVYEPITPKYVSHTRRGILTPTSRKCGNKYIWTKQ